MTNGLIYKQELADVVKSFLCYVKKPEKSSLQFSSDKFHMAAGLTKKILIENIEKYYNQIGNACNYYCNTFANEDELLLHDGIKINCIPITLILKGRAENLKREDFNGVDTVSGGYISFPHLNLKLNV